MNRSELEAVAMTGDKLLTKGGMNLIRLGTGESFSHVAVLVRRDSGLHVHEFAAENGYRDMPLREWLDLYREKSVFYGQAPEVVRSNPSEILKTIAKYMNGKPLQRSYGWVSLLKVWWSQVTGRSVRVLQRVCSTFAQECDEAAGFAGYTRTADPGDIAEVCIVYPLSR